MKKAVKKTKETTTLLIDGYNLCFHQAFLRHSPHHFNTREKGRPTSLLELRKELIRLLRNYLTQIPPSKRPLCEVIFDGQGPQNPLDSSLSHAHLRITFSPKELSADELLLEKSLGQAEMAKRKGVNQRAPSCVVTSDRELQRACRALGTQTMEGEAFFDLLKSKARQKTQETKTTPLISKGWEIYYTKLFEEHAWGQKPPQE